MADQPLAPRSAAELDRLYEVADEAARHALEHYDKSDWLDVPFAQIMLSGARSLRDAGRNPSPAVVEAMERCTEMHRAWADVWVGEETEEATSLTAPEPEEPDAVEPIKIKVGLSDIVRALKVAKA